MVVGRPETSSGAADDRDAQLVGVSVTTLGERSVEAMIWPMSLIPWASNSV
jgi:hypothetical protein